MKLNATILALVFIAVSFLALAQVSVKLKNGRQMNGYFVSINENKLILALPSGAGKMEISLSKDEVENIEGLGFDEFQRAQKTYDSYQREGNEKGFETSFNEALKIVAEKRQRPFLFEVKKEVVTTEKLKEYLQAHLEKLYSDEDLEKEKKLLEVLGLIPKGIDYKKMVTDLFTESVSGLYDPRENKMYILKEATSLISPLLPSEVIIHELIHALQDQYFFLDHFEGDLKKYSMDQSLAARAVVEGEATFGSYSIAADLIKKIGQAQTLSDEFDNLDIEKFILESMLVAAKSYTQEFKSRSAITYLLFPYVRGGMFVKYAFDNGGWDRVNKLYKDYPQSTEQIIHPEKYFLVRDNPLLLEKRDFGFLKQEGFQEISQGTLGEIMLYTAANVFLDDLYSGMISAGWGNDRYYLYEKGGLTLFILDTLWDSPQEAKEFFTGQKAILEKKYSGIVWKEAEKYLRGENEASLVYVAQDNNSVVIVESEHKDENILKNIKNVFASPRQIEAQ